MARRFLLIVLSLVSANMVFAGEHSKAVSKPKPVYSAPEVCTGFGPQTPRDIDNKAGDNKQLFPLANKYNQMNLCNIHMHKNAEHRAKAFSIDAEPESAGASSGFQCGISQTLSPKELKEPKGEICHDLKPGDTIEVHWVFSSCTVKPGEGLGACSSATCSNPSLRVESQVFTLVNDNSALNFDAFSDDKRPINGYYQPKSLALNTGTPIEFLGSTTGPKYNDQQCSPLQVTWSVRPSCAKLNINTLGKWCKSNSFKEAHAHGVRKLVTDYRLLSEIAP